MSTLLTPALKMHGYDVQVFQPSNPSESLKFNILSDVDPRDRTYINEIADIIIKSSFAQSTPENSFWEQGASQLLSCLIEGICTSLPSSERTLETVYKYLNIFMSDREKVNELMINLPETSYTEYLGIISAESKMINSFASTAKVALKLMSSLDVCEVTSASTFDPYDLRRKKIVVFLVIEEFRLKTFAFLSTLFMHSIMRALMAKRTPEIEPYLNQFLICDEFANALTYNEMIPPFLSTCRKKGVCCLIMLQSIDQIFINYSKSEGNTILDNLNTQIFYPGMMNIEALKKVQILLGKNTGGEYTWFGGFSDKKQNQPKDLLSLEAIRTLKPNRGILITNALPAVLIRPRAWFNSRWCKRQIKKGRRTQQ
jgi:type IV secretion system protein VirD4